jgi:hypothetical protein
MDAQADERLLRASDKRQLDGGWKAGVSSSLPTAVGAMNSSSDVFSKRLACRELSELTGPVMY